MIMIISNNKMVIETILALAMLVVQVEIANFSLYWPGIGI